MLGAGLLTPPTAEALFGNLAKHRSFPFPAASGFPYVEIVGARSPAELALGAGLCKCNDLIGGEGDLRFSGGATILATRTATSPAFSGSRINTPAPARW